MDRVNDTSNELNRSQYKTLLSDTSKKLKSLDHFRVSPFISLISMGLICKEQLIITCSLLANCLEQCKKWIIAYHKNCTYQTITIKPYCMILHYNTDCQNQNVQVSASVAKPIAKRFDMIYFTNSRT